MNRKGWFIAAAILFLVGAAARLGARWKEEGADQQVSIVVDWAEVRDAFAREHISDGELLQSLHDVGANAVLIGASTVEDYLLANPSADRFSLDFPNRVVGETVFHQLQERGVAGVSVKPVAGQVRVQPVGGNWDRLKDVEVGFNPELLGKARQVGMHLILRVNNDPWLSRENLFSDLQEIASANQDLGVLLNTDEIPGGMEALPQWVSFLENQNFLQLLFEFHPTKSSVKLAFQSPRSTFRAHTIAPNELRDLPPEAQTSRWRRAVQERSCRFLLVHVSPNDSLVSFFDNLRAVRQDILNQRFSVGWPHPHSQWHLPSFAERRLAPLLALMLAIIFPVMALRSSLGEKPWSAYLRVFFLTLFGASIVAAVAQNPWTRLEVVPFRGIKIAFALSWLGSVGVLFPWTEIKSELYQVVRRIDVLVGVGILVIVGYALVRSGNASAGWKAGWEQGLRDRMEDLLVARPRFKEFAIGYPLLLAGLQWRRFRRGRFLIAVGMIGPISMVNTFCHLHSPLYLAYWRSLNGFILGTVVGLGLIWAWERRRSRFES